MNIRQDWSDFGWRFWTWRQKRERRARICRALAASIIKDLSEPPSWSPDGITDRVDVSWDGEP